MHFLIPKSFNHEAELKGFEVTTYPINFLIFQNFFISKTLYASRHGDLFIGGDNILVNNFNKKTIHMTETETDIIRLLFKKKIVEREEIKKKILKLNLEIETKSLDSHLSRIRKKLKDVSSDLKIFSTNPREIQII